MLSEEEEIKQFKQQIMKQLEAWPEDQREAAKEQIESMSAEEFEEFLKKNNMLKESKGGECIFCSIVQNKAPSYKLDENKAGLAILEINPLSKGHTLILSKDHKNLKASAFFLATKLAKRLKSKLKAEDVKIENSKILGHEAIQVIPIYKDKKLEKTQASEKELILLQDKLKSKQRVKKQKKPAQSSVLLKAPVRFP